MTVHLWVRAEQRANEQRVGLTPDGAAALIKAGLTVTVEDSATRAIPTERFRAAGCAIAPTGSWPDAPADTIIFGLKELPADGSPLRHRHIMFGHAFKGQPDGQVLLRRFRDGGGALFDLEYLVGTDGRRVAAFGYWAGYAGAAVALKCWAAMQRGGICGPVEVSASQQALREDLREDLSNVGTALPNVLIIGALGRVGTGAGDLCEDLGAGVTRWDMAETAQGGPFPAILEHGIFLNCILARPGTPVFVQPDAGTQPRALAVIGDIACDPDSDFNPIQVYDRVTDWAEPARRVHQDPPLDVTAIDNLPSLLPVESSEDFAGQLLPSLMTLGDPSAGVWGRARTTFEEHLGSIGR